ncbi:lysoplasmalogenase [Flagellimonas nanhaiensis]|uniref:Lysoplasmalogenase n=1 Tax=Flagellimonas nanhaiensis TaxID=2292706 RepID=A0A371JQ92_9FLAO|nr:lysoplasmalogenase [Allomuricauda nanhaiensis]RDY59680.1 lysoplasmalogenase [Allomuricauda nanhaiensis]
MVRAINILIAFSALLAIYSEYSGYRMLYLFLKPLTTILVISILFFASKTAKPKFKNTVFIALIFCLLGDVFLLFEGYFVFGLGSFLMAHLLFAMAFIRLEGFYFNYISLFAFLAIGLILFLWLKPDLGSFLIPVGLYIAVILFMAWQGTGLFLKKKRHAYALIALVVVLFMFSDSMIAVNKFKSPFTLAGPIILSTYWLSVALISNATYKISTQEN